MECLQKFANVLIKFFTKGFRNENKGATEVNGNEDPPMLTQIKTAARRSADTLLGDFIGGAALIVTLVGGLYLPGLM